MISNHFQSAKIVIISILPIEVIFGGSFLWCQSVKVSK